jgi:hypothetical protein
MVIKHGLQLSCHEILLVLLPTGTNAIARLGTIAGFLLRRLVGGILVGSLLREGISKPFGILLEGRWVVECTRVCRCPARIRGRKLSSWRRPVAVYPRMRIIIIAITWTWVISLPFPVVR